MGKELITFDPTPIFNQLKHEYKAENFPSINSFTQFGMLTPLQIFILFIFFKNSPKYETFKVNYDGIHKNENDKQ